jgi:hypothetical protein
VRKEAVEGRVVLLLAATARRLNQSRDAVAPGTADPPGHQSGEGLKPWFGETRSEGQEKLLQAQWNDGIKQADSSFFCV